jgi:hypothetical protein
MLTRLINLLGAFAGPENLLLGPDRDNPKGFWERTDVFPINDALLGLRGCTWKVVAGWDLAQPPEPPPDLAESMRRIVSGMDVYRPWVMKDPRMCLTLPCWAPILETPIAVLIYRDPLEIACSLKERGMSPAHSLALWEHYAVSALAASERVPRLFVQHNRLLADPVDTLTRLAAELRSQGVRGLQMPSTVTINGWVDPRLHRAKGDGLAGEIGLSAAQETLAAILRGERSQDRTLAVSAESVARMARAKTEQANL